MSAIDTYTAHSQRLLKRYKTLDFMSLERGFWMATTPPTMAQHTIEIPLKLSRNLELSIDIKIANQPAQAVIDTAAIQASFDLNDLPPRLRRQVRRARHERLSQKSPDGLVPVPDITIGAQQYSNMRARLTDRQDERRTRNIIPAAQLRGAVLDFDFQNRILQVYSGAPAVAPQSRQTTFGYGLHRGEMHIPIALNGLSGQAIIDTGLNYSTVNPDLVVGASVYDLTLGGMAITNAKFVHSARRIFDPLGQNKPPIMRLGLDLLQHYRVQIDRERQCLTLWR